jgi:hypothetical protein
MKVLFCFLTLQMFCSSYSLAENFNFDLQRHFQPTLEYIVLEKPYIRIIENSSGLSGQCQLMQGNYLSLWREYNAESLQLMSLLNQVRGATPYVKLDLLPQIQEIQVKLKKTIDELNRLVRPEWNQETLKVAVSWSLPQSILFSVSEDDPDIIDNLADKSALSFFAAKGLPVRSGLPPKYLDGLRNIKKKTYFDGVDYLVTEAQYMGEDSAVLLSSFSVQGLLFQSWMEQIIHFDYFKPMTWLEYCQFTQTAEFSVNVKFVLRNYGGGYAEKNQKFILRSL